MNEPIVIAGVLLYGYLIGSVHMAYVAGRVVKGVDLRRVGSGSVGASNVWYNVGKFWIFPVGIFDLFVKGLTPVLVARMGGLPLEWQAAAGLAAVAGHNWPVWLRFRGGRGVAPMVGVLMGLARLELAVFIVMATAGWRLTNAAAVWVLVALAALPIVSWWWGRPGATIGLLVGVFAITVVKRILANTPRPEGMPLRELLVNRLLFDRDIRDHEAWVRRTQLAR